MAKNVIIKTHTVQHMWEKYAATLLKENENYIGVHHNKIQNFYIYDITKKLTPRKVKVTYKPTVKDGHIKNRSWVTPVHTATGLVHSYTEFRKIIETYFRIAKTEIIKGNSVGIRSIGRICAVRVERDFRKKNHRKVNWEKTMQQEATIWNEAKQRMVRKAMYHIDNDWCRIGWFKNAITNISLYEFKPAAVNGTTRNSGFKFEFTNALGKDPLLKYQYLYCPIKDFEYVEP